MATINESGLYSLILGSRKPEAKRFKKWVTSEGLPAIRKTGSYNGPAIDPMKVVNESALTTDSCWVAKHFKKRHNNVLQVFDKMECSEEFSRLHFEAAEELDSQGKPRRMVLMTKDGFIFLVMSFTGKEAARIKEVYIGAFNEMAGEPSRPTMSTNPASTA